MPVIDHSVPNLTLNIAIKDIVLGLSSVDLNNGKEILSITVYKRVIQAAYTWDII